MMFPKTKKLIIAGLTAARLATMPLFANPTTPARPTTTAPDFAPYTANTPATSTAQPQFAAPASTAKYHVGETVYYLGEKPGTVTKVLPASATEQQLTLYEIVFANEDASYLITENLLETDNQQQLDARIDNYSHQVAAANTPTTRTVAPTATNAHTNPTSDANTMTARPTTPPTATNARTTAPTKLEYQTFATDEIELDGIADKLVSINQKVQEIFGLLQIQPSTAVEDQKYNAFILFKYVIENSTYQIEIMQEKANSQATTLCEFEIEDIYKNLCEGRSVCTGDAASLSLLLRRAGINSRHLTIAEKGAQPQGVHEVVKMDFDGKPYICDPTLVRTALENGMIHEVSPRVFAFPPEAFFQALYPSKEVKYEHTVPRALQ